MVDLLEAIRESAKLQGKSLADIEFPQVIKLEPGAIRHTAEFLTGNGFHTIVLVADSITFEKVGQTLLNDMKKNGLTASVTLLKPNLLGDIVADEASVVQVLLDIQRTRADVLVAVGAGTIHDITRYAAYTSAISFISIPTAPSVDGFTSKGAPLLIRGDKITVPAIGPLAIFADTDILRDAPASMVAAGFGDMLGKYTSLFDWKFGSLTDNEPFDPFVAEITTKSLMACIDHVDSIGRRTEEGIKVLTQALIESGIAMLIFGQSHPASGAEHHLSHYWEMEFIRNGRRQLLHGAKVGVACSVITSLYKRIAEVGLPTTGTDLQISPARNSAEAHWPEIRKLILTLPEEAQIREWLQLVQGPPTLTALGIDNELLERSLREADQVRPNRSTLLRMYNNRL